MRVCVCVLARERVWCELRGSIETLQSPSRLLFSGFKILLPTTLFGREERCGVHKENLRGLDGGGEVLFIQSYFRRVQRFRRDFRLPLHLFALHSLNLFVRITLAAMCVAANAAVQAVLNATTVGDVAPKQINPLARKLLPATITAALDNPRAFLAYGFFLNCLRSIFTMDGINMLSVRLLSNLRRTGSSQL